MKTRILKCAAAVLWGALSCMLALQAGAQTDANPVLSPDAVAPDPALSPEDMNAPPVLSPDATTPNPVLSPDNMYEPPVRSPDATVPDPALSPEQMSAPPIPEAN